MAEAARDDLTELVVDQPLAAELTRRGVQGVHVGDRVRLELVHGSAEATEDSMTLPAFFGSFASDEGDLAERVDEIVSAEILRKHRAQ